MNGMLDQSVFVVFVVSCFVRFVCFVGCFCWVLLVFVLPCLCFGCWCLFAVGFLLVFVGCCGWFVLFFVFCLVVRFGFVLVVLFGLFDSID